MNSFNDYVLSEKLEKIFKQKILKKNLKKYLLTHDSIPQDVTLFALYTNKEYEEFKRSVWANDLANEYVEEVANLIDYEFGTDVHVGDILWRNPDNTFCISSYEYKFTDNKNRRPIAVCAIPKGIYQEDDSYTFIGLHNIYLDDANNVLESDYRIEDTAVSRADNTNWCTSNALPSNLSINCLPHFPIVSHEVFDTDGKLQAVEMDYKIIGKSNYCYIPTDDVEQMINNKFNPKPYEKDLGTYFTDITEPAIHLNSALLTSYSPYYNVKPGTLTVLKEDFCDMYYTDNEERTEYDFGNAFHDKCGLHNTIQMNKACSNNNILYPAAYASQHYTCGIPETEGNWYVPSPFECACMIARMKKINLALEVVGDSFRGGVTDRTAKTYPIVTSGYCGISGGYYNGLPSCVFADFAGSQVACHFGMDSSYKCRPVIQLKISDIQIYR